MDRNRGELYDGSMQAEARGQVRWVWFLTERRIKWI